MKNSPKHFVNKAISLSVRLGLSGIICAGALLSTDALAGNTTYQYDALGRVIKVTYPDSKQICYVYDSAGNRTQVKRQSTGTCTVTGSTLSSAVTAETMFTATQNSELLATSGTTAATDDQVVTDSATSTTDTTTPTN